MGAIFDISQSLSPTMLRWPESPAVSFTKRLSLARGDKADDTVVQLGAHAGTHVDAPAHFIPGGATVDQLALADLIGPAQVVDLGEAPIITGALLTNLAIPAGATRLLFRTSNSLRLQHSGEFFRDYVALDDSAAEWLVSRGILLVGIDGFSIEPFGGQYHTHQILLRAGMIVLEGILLQGVPEGLYELICLPIKFEGVEAAPGRAILRSLP